MRQCYISQLSECKMDDGMKHTPDEFDEYLHSGDPEVRKRAEKIGKSERTVSSMTRGLQGKGLLAREYGKRNGAWKVLLQ